MSYSTDSSEQRTGIGESPEESSPGGFAIFLRIYNLIKDHMDELILLGVAGFLFFVTTNIQTGWLYFVISLIVTFLIIGFVTSRKNLSGISIGRRFLPMHQEDEKVKVTLRVTNPGSFPRFLLFLEDSFPVMKPGVKLPKVFIPYVPAKGHADETYEREAYLRGVHVFGSVTVKSSGIPGFFPITRKFSAESAKLIVLPRPLESREIAPKEKNARANRERHSTSLLGQSFDFAGIREYQPGNEMRHIHWASTARLDKLMVKEFFAGSSRTIAVFIDNHRESVFGSGRETTFEHMVRTAASILRDARRTNIRVDLLFSGGREVIALRNASSPRGRRKLAELRADSAESPDKQMNEIIRKSSHSGSLVLLKGLPFETAWWDDVSYNVRKNITVVFFPPAGFLAEGDPERETLESLPYPSQAESLRRAGIRVIFHDFSLHADHITDESSGNHVEVPG